MPKSTFAHPAHQRSDTPCEWCGRRWIMSGRHAVALIHAPDCAYLAYLKTVDDIKNGRVD